MHTYKWQDKYSIGVEGIDLEHKNLLASVNKLLCAQNMDKAIILKLADEVVLYAEFHFLSEENVMYLLKYPDISDHTEEHRNLIKQLKNKRKHLDESLDCLQEFVNFLIRWFVDHIQTTDRQLGEYIKAYKADKDTPEYLIKSMELEV